VLSGGRLVGRHVVVKGIPFGEHQQDNVVVGPDGRLYWGSGSTCDVCHERSPRSAAILSLRPDGSDLRVVARGLRTPDGIAFWHGDLFVAEWGQYLSHRFGRRVVRVHLRAGHRGLVTSFASGFSHPLALLDDRTGGLLVADWGRGVVYRVAPLEVR